MVLTQIALALSYYTALVLMMRLAGKRLAGQMTTFDLLVLITLGVVLQQAMLLQGRINQAVFVATVFLAHRAVAAACNRWEPLRRIVRGAPRALVRDGVIMERALAEEGLTRADLLAGLRKAGFGSADDVLFAVVEETGHISAVARTPD